MRVLQRMARDHVAPNPDHALADLLVSIGFYFVDLKLKNPTSELCYVVVIRII